jgi:hypothetical protein
VSSSTPSYGVWILIAVAALVLWWASFLRPAVVARPADVVSRIVTHPVMRVLFVLGLMWLGWHMFAR